MKRISAIVGVICLAAVAAATAYGAVAVNVSSNSSTKHSAT